MIHLKITLKNFIERLTDFIIGIIDLMSHAHFTIYFFLLSAVFPCVLALTFFVVFPTMNKSINSVTQETNGQINDIRPVDLDNRSKKQEIIKEIDSMQVEKSYFQALLDISITDTFNLSLNLRDSLICLNIRGVAVRQCKIYNFSCTKAFHYIRTQGVLYQYNAAPFVLQRDFSTIEKIPIKVIHAPKDTTEAYERMNQKIRLEKPDVYCSLFFDKDLIIDIGQTKSPGFNGLTKKAVYLFRWKTFLFKENIKALFHFKKPRHSMWIKIQITADDAKALYRSLKNHMRLALLI